MHGYKRKVRLMHHEYKSLQSRGIYTMIFAWKLFFSNSVTTLILIEPSCIRHGCLDMVVSLHNQFAGPFCGRFQCCFEQSMQVTLFSIAYLTSIRALCQASCVIYGINIPACRSYARRLFILCSFDDPVLTTSKFNEEICLVVSIYCAAFGDDNMMINH